MDLNEFYKTIEDFIFVEDEPEPCDILFLPGNRYPQMARRCASLYKEGYAPLILPSGRYAAGHRAFEGALAMEKIYPGPYPTEWAFLEDVLRKEGVPGEAVLREDKATYTWQNALFSRQVTDREGLTIRKAILCCKTTHARRCLQYYQTAFPDTRFLVCPVDCEGISRRNWRQSSEGIHAVMGEAERLVEQFSLMMQPDRLRFPGKPDDRAEP